MTVSYSYILSRTGPFTSIRLLFKWRGSVFKILLIETLVYFLAYSIISVCYRFAMPTESQRLFEKIVTYCQSFSSMIPVTFILGFYVTIVFTRWNGLFGSIPWPDKTLMLMSTYLKLGDDQKACRVYRRSVVRYMVSAQVLVLRNISMQVKKRFPTIQHIVDSGLLTEDEGKTMEEIESATGDTKYWMPLEWSMAILNRATLEKKISSDCLQNNVNEKIIEFRNNLTQMLMYDWVNIPLIYTQIVTIAVWTFFLAGLIGNQWLITEKNIDLYVPCFAILQFICLMGWLRVAQNLLNPLGENDDDFELNWIIDRNLQVGFAIVDDTVRKLPEPKFDIFYDEEKPELPHTEASLPTANQVMQNSCADVEIDRKASHQVASVAVSRQPSSRSSLRSTSKASQGFNNKASLAGIPGGLRRLKRSISRPSTSSHAGAKGSVTTENIGVTITDDVFGEPPMNYFGDQNNIRKETISNLNSNANLHQLQQISDRKTSITTAVENYSNKNGEKNGQVAASLPTITPPPKNISPVPSSASIGAATFSVQTWLSEPVVSQPASSKNSFVETGSPKPNKPRTVTARHSFLTVSEDDIANSTGQNDNSTTGATKRFLSTVMEEDGGNPHSRIPNRSSDLLSDKTAVAYDGGRMKSPLLSPPFSSVKNSQHVQKNSPPIVLPGYPKEEEIKSPRSPRVYDVPTGLTEEDGKEEETEDNKDNKMSVNNEEPSTARIIIIHQNGVHHEHM